MVQAAWVGVWLLGGGLQIFPVRFSLLECNLTRLVIISM